LRAGLSAGDQNVLLDRGYLQRSSKDRAVTVSFHPSSNYVATHGTDKNVEIFRIRSQDEIKRVLKRKRKRKAEKGKEDEEAAAVAGLAGATVEDIFTSYVILRTGSRVRSIDWAAKGGKDTVQLLVHLSNNSLEYYDVPKSPSKEKSKS